MSPSLWRCKNRECPVPGGAPLGRVTFEGTLVLDEAVVGVRAILDCRRGVEPCLRHGRARASWRPQGVA